MLTGEFVKDKVVVVTGAGGGIGHGIGPSGTCGLV